MKKYIIDTDIGDDIDDALALALALNMPEVELIGVTTVFLDTLKRARIAKKLLHLWGSFIPVYAGLAKGNTSHDITAVPCQYTPDLEIPENEPENDPRLDGGEGAVDYLLRSAREYADALTIVAVGPLTNVAEAFRRDPEAMRKVRIVIMGGCFYRQFSEWNVLCDPDAAKVVLESKGDLTCVGIEVTEQTTLNDAQQAFLMKPAEDARYDYLAHLVRLHYNHTGRKVCLHDPLTMYYAVHPEVLTTEKILVKVETSGEVCAGMTVNMEEMFHYLPLPLPGDRVTVAKTVDLDMFMKGFFDIVYQADALV